MSEMLNGREPIAIVFGTRRLADQWAWLNLMDPRRVFTAIWGVDVLHGVNGLVKIVRFPEDIWQPSTFSDERRVRELEVELKRLKKLYPERVVEVS